VARNLKVIFTLMFNARKILVLAPHTDDGELGCGATIAKYCREGADVYYAAFCLCAKSLPPGLPPDTLEQECKAATALLGIRPENLILFNYEVRELPAARQQVLEELVTLQKKINPDLVFLPSSADVHQDHQVIHQEGLRAFKHTSIAGYELPWNNYSFTTTCFNRLGETELAAKIAALKAYRSQAHRNYMQEEFIRSLAKVRGVQCNNGYAEAFEIYRLLS
jgi:N-acetylglucosamine malate deacetylase 1